MFRSKFKDSHAFAYRKTYRAANPIESLTTTQRPVMSWYELASYL